ncbi:MAG: diguanylate cyclase [Candidatus Omnitrophota bacterium]
MMDNEKETTFLGEDLLERIAYVSSELDEIVDITKGEKKDDESQRLHKPTTLQSIFKYLVLKNVTRGRMALSVYFSGKEVGFACQPKTKEDLVKLVRRLGLGTLSINEFGEENIILELKDSLSSRDIKGLQKNVCYFEAGFFGGAIENILNRKIDFKESQCVASEASEICRFEMIKPGEQIKIEGVTIPILTVKGYSPENVKLLTSLASHAIAAIENALVFETTRKQALIDGLTETFNHRFFQQTIRTELKRSSRHDMPLAMMMCDIDKFKEYNDKYGHSVGDDALKKIANILKSNIREIDFVSRYGGDEFAVLFPQTYQQGAMIAAQRILEKVNQCKFPKLESDSYLSISIGIAGIPGRTELSAQDLIDKADKALRIAKKGKLKIVVAE